MKVWWVRWLLVCWLALIGLPVQAGEVRVEGEVLFRLADPAEAAALSARIVRLLEAGEPAGEIQVEKLEGRFTVLWGRVPLVAVTRELALSNHSEPEALARRWAASLRRVAELGLLRVDRARVELPVGGRERIRLGGLARGAVSLSETGGLIKVAVDEASGDLILEGRAVGRARLDISRGAGRQSVWIQIKDWAGDLPESVPVRVTGRPAPGSMVLEAALAAVLTRTDLRPGCRLLLDGELPPLPPLPPSGTTRIQLPLRVEGGEDYYPRQGRVTVSVSNLGLPQVESNLLLVSNRPERVSVDGVLLEYTFSEREPTRLMYSHMNESPTPRHLWVNLSNPTSEPLELMVGWTFAGPGRSEIHVGQTAARRFLGLLGSDAGYVVTLPPRSALELAGHRMAPQALVNGFANFRILRGTQATVEVRTALAPARNDGSRLPHLGAPFNPFKIHPHGVFAQPFFEHELEFVTGGEPATLRYGESPWLIDFETGLPNTGNFGVLYKALVDLHNPDSRPRRVGLFFEPLSGAGGGTFLVGGEVHQAPFRRKNQECLVTSVELSPGERRTLEVVTFPEATSNYPAQFQFRDLAGPREAGGVSTVAPGAGRP